MKSIKKNYVFNTTYQIIALIIPLITTPYLSRVLGSNSVGDYSYANAMATYFVLLSIFGTTTFGQRVISYNREDTETMRVSFWNNVFLRTLFSVSSLFFYYVYLSASKSINPLTLSLGILIIDTMFDISWFYQGREEFLGILIKNTIIKLLTLISVFVFVKTSNDTWIYALILSSSTIIGSFSLWFGAFKMVGAPKIKRPFSSVKDIALIFLPTISIQVYAILDKSMIGWITNSSYENGCYELSERIVRMAITLVTSIGVVLLPRIAYLFKSNEKEQLRYYMEKAFSFVWFLSLPMVFGIFSISNLFVPLFLGDGYDKSSILLPILSPMIIFVGLSYVVGIAYLISTKQQNVYTIAVTIAAFVNLLLNIPLIIFFSSIGAAIATVLAEMTGCIIQLVYCIGKKQLSFKSVFRNFLKPFFASSIMLIALLVLEHFMPSSILTLVLIIFIGVLIYGLISILLKEENVMRFFRSVKMKFKCKGSQK